MDSKLKNGQLTLGAHFLGVLFCIPILFFGPGGIAQRQTQGVW